MDNLKIEGEISLWYKCDCSNEVLHIEEEVLHIEEEVIKISEINRKDLPTIPNRGQIFSVRERIKANYLEEKHKERDLFAQKEVSDENINGNACI